MTQAITAQSMYDSKRDRRKPPQVSVKYLRLARRETLDDVLDQVKELTNREYTRGALSAVENGHRGASLDLLDALEKVYGLPPRSISIDYIPSPPRRKQQPAKTVHRGDEGLALVSQQE